ncbi:MAG: sialidase family protein, partial [Burkholderiales bacterium]
MTLTRSTDDGLTWGPSGGVTIAAGGQGAQVAVGTDHSVYFEWLAGASILIRRSTDQGLTFAAATTVTPILSAGVNGDLGLGGGFRSSTFPQLAVNPVNGNLYTVYPDNPAGADKADVFFRQSTDNGTTWSAAVRVNTDLGTNDNWQPSLAVTPDGTALHVGMYDRRRSGTNNRIEYWGRTATISGSTVTFGCNFPISSSDFPVVVGVDPVINAVYMGDYDMATATNANFYVQWGDNRLGNPDVRFALVPKAGVTTPALLSLVSQSLSGPPTANSCNNLTITVGNEGCTATIGAVTGTLTTSTPGVTIVDPVQNFGMIASGGTGSNASPFMVSIASSFACGTTITATLTMSNG